MKYTNTLNRETYISTTEIHQKSGGLDGVR